MCQAREDTDGNGRVEVAVTADGRLTGDQMQTFLVRGKNQEQPIQALLAADPAGRWLVLQRNERSVLLDTHTDSEVDLTARGADTRNDRSSYQPHRTLSFDESGTHLLYVRREEGATRVVVRDLAAGTESTINPGPGVLWRAELDALGKWAILHMLAQDTNGNGRLDWPIPPSRSHAEPCRGPIPRMDAWGFRGDRPVVRLARSSGGKAESRPTFVAAFGKDLVLREPGGRLVLRRVPGRDYQLAPALCQARVLHVDPSRQLVVATCTPAQGPSKVNLLGVTFRQELELELSPPPYDRQPQQQQRLLAFYPGREAVLLDLDRRHLRPLQPNDAVLATRGPWALIRRDRSLVFLNAETGEQQSLPGQTAPLLEHRVTGAMVVAQPLVVDLAARRLLGRVEGQPLALTRAGQVLVAAGRDADARALAVGPLRWVEPKPEPPK